MSAPPEPHLRPSDASILAAPSKNSVYGPGSEEGYFRSRGLCRRRRGLPRHLLPSLHSRGDGVHTGPPPLPRKCLPHLRATPTSYPVLHIPQTTCGVRMRWPRTSGAPRPLMNAPICQSRDRHECCICASVASSEHAPVQHSVVYIGAWRIASLPAQLAQSDPFWTPRLRGRHTTASTPWLSSRRTLLHHDRHQHHPA